MGGDDLRWLHVTAAAARGLCAGAWAAARGAGAPTRIAFPEGSPHTYAFRAQNVLAFEIAWSGATALGRVAWRRDWLDAVDSVVAWTALSVALGGILGFGSLELLIAFAGLEVVGALAAALWVQPARRRPALVRSALVAGAAHAAATVVAVSRAVAGKNTATAAACTFSAAAAAAAAATYAADGGAPDGGVGAFESDARAAAQLAARVAVFFAFEAALLKEAGGPSPLGVPAETLEVVAPLACAALFGIWFLISYPEKTEKPVYQDIGSLRGGREEAERARPPWAVASAQSRETAGGPRAIALSSPLQSYPAPPSKKKSRGTEHLLPLAAPPPSQPPPRQSFQSASFSFSL